MTILQIMPAEAGWKGLYVDTPEEVFTLPIIGWALVEEDGYREVVGLDACGDEIGPVIPDGQFVRYLAPGDDPADFSQDIREAWDRIVAKR